MLRLINPPHLAIEGVSKMLWGSGPKSLHQNPTTGRPNRLFNSKPNHNPGWKTIIPDFGCPFRSGLSPKSPVDLHGLLRGAVLGLPCLNSRHPANLCLFPQGGGTACQTLALSFRHRRSPQFLTLNPKVLPVADTRNVCAN